VFDQGLLGSTGTQQISGGKLVELAEVSKS